MLGRVRRGRGTSHGRVQTVTVTVNRESANLFSGRKRARESGASEAPFRAVFLVQPPSVRASLLAVPSCIHTGHARGSAQRVKWGRGGLLRRRGRIEVKPQRDERGSHRRQAWCFLKMDNVAPGGDPATADRRKSCDLCCSRKRCARRETRVMETDSWRGGRERGGRASSRRMASSNL